MKNLTIFFLLQTTLFLAQEFKLPYEIGNGNQTTTYADMLDFYNALDRESENISIENFGQDDNGEPIKVVVFTPSNNKNLPVLLINNGIHPGEPDGIDATMMLMRDLATGKIQSKNLKVAAVQCYNISGMQRRGKFSRVNQNGPEEYGFRGNARNYDLNRDFIKNDTDNAKAFQQLFHHYKPIYFIDNHVSNGADYQYLFTYISSNKERLGKTLGNYLHTKMQPVLMQQLEARGILTTPYVNIHGEAPDKGFPAFMDSPRYATGYTALFNTMGTVAETHMLKPYTDRVKATYEYMLSSLEYVGKNRSEIQKKMAESAAELRPGKKYTLRWKLSENKHRLLDFKGYEARQKRSAVSGTPRLYYDRTKPFNRKVKFFDEYSSELQVTVPRYYVVPKSERTVIGHLKRNRIQMRELHRDSAVMVEMYTIVDFQTVTSPYEGHYLHYDTQTKSEFMNIKINKGDFLVPCAQEGVKYLLETLEPAATDSFFNWNFFDAILGQKEYFSDYVFEDTAAELLSNDTVLKTAFEMEKVINPKFAKDPRAQLDWIYKRSPYFEQTVNRYPIFRLP
ncbi:M14 family metallopeptidase [Kaistella sp. PBT33-4]|uniref:M14 family metallopeptidase n=1 Tax=Kaistella sp. PBT33-4 TaxID=3032000 RepID=UPI0023D84428|nr:M14 family metallopeptidase [Kaistella sp. PBT33-4]MDF0719148.1 M14 family metallopeptidase [Kaistella sp. PBT33-4]